jgi:hypothetical protein
MAHDATLVPDHPTGNIVYQVFDDLGLSGRVWREIDGAKTGARNIAREIIDGDYQRPIKIVAVDLHENWVWDMTEDVARLVIEIARAENLMLRKVTAEFVARATGQDLPADVLEAHRAW